MTNSRQKVLQALRLLPEPGRVLRGAVDDGRRFEGLELAAAAASAVFDKIAAKGRLSERVAKCRRFGCH